MDPTWVDEEGDDEWEWEDNQREGGQPTGGASPELSAEEKELRALVGRRVGTRLPGMGYCEGVITSFTDAGKALVAFDQPYP